MGTLKQTNEIIAQETLHQERLKKRGIIVAKNKEARIIEGLIDIIREQDDLLKGIALEVTDTNMKLSKLEGKS